MRGDDLCLTEPQVLQGGRRPEQLRPTVERCARAHWGPAVRDQAAAELVLEDGAHTAAQGGRRLEGGEHEATVTSLGWALHKP